MLWLAAAEFGDDGTHFRRQVHVSLPEIWRLGIEDDGQPTFESVFREWGTGGT